MAAIAPLLMSFLATSLASLASGMGLFFFFIISSSELALSFRSYSV